MPKIGMASDKRSTEEPRNMEEPPEGHCSPGVELGGLQKNHLDITNLVRSIQRAEGNPDCFRKGGADCDRWDCSWRSYCLKEEGDYSE